MLIDKLSATSKLVNSFDEFNNRSKYIVLLTIKHKMDIIERIIEKLCGSGEALKQGEPSNVSWMGWKRVLTISNIFLIQKRIC